MHSAYKLWPGAFKLARKDIATPSDPYFKVVGKPKGFSREITLYSSEVIMNKANPDWNSFVLNTADVKGIDGPIKVLVYDWDKNGSYLLIY